MNVKHPVESSFFTNCIMYSIVKVCAKNNLPFEFCFADISASVSWIFKILVPTPHDIPLYNIVR